MNLRPAAAVAVVIGALGAVPSCEKSSDDAGRPPAPATTLPVPAAAADALRGRPATRPDVYQAGDLLEVRVVGLPAPAAPTPTVARVQADGTISLMYVPDVPVAGRTAAECGLLVTDAYRNGNVFSNAPVDVRRLQVAGTGGPSAGPIGPYDLVRCTVNELSDDKARPTVTVRRVDGRGELALLFIAPVKVAGLTDGRAAAAVAAAYREANIVSHAPVSVLTLERAPAGADHLALPDGPIGPVPEPLRDLYVAR